MSPLNARPSRVVHALGAIGVLATIGAGAAPSHRPATDDAPPPIAVDELTADGTRPVRGEFADAIGASFDIAYEGTEAVTIDAPDLSHMAVARITLQPGARFPWHTHPGPVLVTVIQGELVYVLADDCVERSYIAGSSFVDHGHGHVHSAFNPTSAETIVLATFLEAPAEGPLTITDGITPPADDCGLSAGDDGH
jgi:quercetin dioxygenase-like cupin family protein